MRDHSRLRELWTAASGSLQERLTAINSLRVEGPRRPIEMSAVRDLLVRRGVWRRLQVHALMGRTADLRARLGQPDVSEGVRASVHLQGLVGENAILQVSQFGVLKKLLDDICADSVIAPDDVSALWALSETSTPWWVSVYGRPISTFDLIEAQLAA